MLLKNFSKSFLKRGSCFFHLRGLSTSPPPTTTTTTTYTPSLTTTHQLSKILQASSWYTKHRLLDATWDLDDKDYRSMHFNHRIPGSKFFSFDECRDVTNQVPRMLPTSDAFSEYVTKLGISNHHHVIVYDNHEIHGLYSSPRVWWMFRVFGHDNVSVLEGGLKKWLLDGYSSISGDYTEEENFPGADLPFKSSKRLWLVKDFEYMKSNCLSKKRVPVADARGRNRYLGVTSDGQKDLKQGHIPGALSVPFSGLFNEDRSMKAVGSIRNYFETNRVNIENEMVVSCGSGVTACVLSLAAHHASKKDVAVYDGSWSEWFERGHDMIVRGEEK